MSAVEELLEPGDVPLWRHPVWSRELPWLVQGTTGAGTADAPFDLGLFGAAPAGEVLGRWRRLRESLGAPSSVHARQVHGAEVVRHAERPPPGMIVMDGFDGHATDAPGILLSVSVADCVPVFIADPGAHAIALLHAGWRGAAAGILEAGIALMAESFGTRASDLWVHCGPAICGVCYEVGPEVHAAVNPDAPAPERPTPIDLRAALIARALGLGAREERTSASGHCTRCGPGAFFSHRGGSPARQMGVLGIRP